MKYVTVYIFRVGDRIKCIKKVGHLEHDKIYTFAGSSEDGGIRVAELPNNSYKVERFKKVINETQC